MYATARYDVAVYFKELTLSWYTSKSCTNFHDNFTNILSLEVLYFAKRNHVLICACTMVFKLFDYFAQDFSFSFRYSPMILFSNDPIL